MSRAVNNRRSRQGKLISEVGPPGKGNVGLSLSDLLRNDTGSVFVVREVSTELVSEAAVHLVRREIDRRRVGKSGLDSLTGLDGGGGKGKSREGRDGRPGSLRAGGEEGSDDSDNVRSRVGRVVRLGKRNLVV